MQQHYISWVRRGWNGSHFVFRHKCMPSAWWPCAVMMHNPTPHIPIFWSFSQHILPRMTQGVNVAMLVYSFFFIVKPIQNAQLSNCRQTLNMLFTSQWTGDDALPLRWGFIAGSHSQIHVSSPVVIIFKKNSGFLLSLSGMSWHVLTWISFCSSPSRQGISLVAITYIFILSFKMLWRSQIDSKCILNFTNSNFPVFWRQVPSLNPHIHLFCSSMDIPNVQHLLHCFWTPKTTQKPLFFQLPVLQKLPPTFWKFLYYFYQFKPPFYANMLCRYNKTANGTTHVRIQTDITTAQSHMSQPHSKQAVTQQPQYHLHSVVTVCVSSSSSSVIFRHAIPLCYLNSTQHNYCYYKNTSVFTKFAICFSQ